MRSIVLALLSLALAAPAQAFCGFFVAGSNDQLTNSASKVVLLRKDDQTVMTLSNNYQGPPENFALVVPVPVVLHKKDVKTLPANVFDHIDALSAPRLVEYWERDPCAPLPPPMPMAAAAGGMMLGGNTRARHASHGVTIEAQFVAGEYQIVILSAKDSGGLEIWLRENHYHLPVGAAQALAPYVREQSKFFVAKVDITKVHRDAHGVVVLSPLRFGFPQKELRLPVRLGLLNANGPQDLLIYVLHPTSRFEAANYPNVFPPTNLEVTDAVRGNFASFYNQLFDAALAQHQGRGIVTEYAWQTTSCDPCPTPPLSPSDIATLGGDQVAPQAMRTGWGYAGWVLTRLHARYDRKTLGEDLVFHEAPPIVGGRGMWNGSSEGDLAPKPSEVNNFQARYIIRHYWKGKVACKSPQWGMWGGPPDGSPEMVAARDLQSAPRGRVKLREVVKTQVPALGLPGHPAPRHH